LIGGLWVGSRLVSYGGLTRSLEDYKIYKLQDLGDFFGIFTLF